MLYTAIRVNTVNTDIMHDPFIGHVNRRDGADVPVQDNNKDKEKIKE